MQRAVIEILRTIAIALVLAGVPWIAGAALGQVLEVTRAEAW